MTAVHLPELPKLPNPRGFLHDANGNDPLTYVQGDLDAATSLLASTCAIYRDSEVVQFARDYATAAVLAERERWKAEREALMRDGPPMERGKKGNGEVWMGTMRDVLNDYMGAADVEARYADEMRAARDSATLAERERAAKVCEALIADHCAGTRLDPDKDGWCLEDGSDGCDFVAAWQDAAAAIRKG
jgi:hypothetical protein